MSCPIAALVALFPCGWSRALPAAMASRPRGASSETMLLCMALAVATITTVCALSYATHRLVQRRRGNSHSLLFAELCRIHGLDRASRRLLKWVARQRRLTQPARLFVDPQWLDPARVGSRRAELAAMRARLFCSPSSDSPPAG